MISSYYGIPKLESSFLMNYLLFHFFTTVMIEEFLEEIREDPMDEDILL